MILVQWSCKIPHANLAPFLKYVKEILKPFYESHGSIRYELFLPLKTNKQYFPYQISDNKNQYTEQLLFKDIKDFDNFYDSIEKDQAAQKVVGMYTKEFGINNCEFKILIQKG
jgi:hypothetical protein